MIDKKDQEIEELRRKLENFQKQEEAKKEE